VHFEGVIPAALTPFDVSGRVDADALFATAGWLLDNGA
jgi:dihydrodipicolinate synthase/N-acetylneuraminate lyase